MRLLSLLAALSLLSLAAGATAQALDDDLVVGWIHRLPELDYVPNSPQPDVDGWPAAGETITWQAVVKNFSAAPRTVDYRWTLDGAEIASGTATLAAAAHTAVDLPWTWTFDRHELGFEIDTADAYAEFEEANNALTVFTDAISVGFWVEQSTYDYFHQYQHELGVGANSWEDWAQRHVARWNRMFLDAVYPLTPDGVLDRIRCDKIVLVPDGALPLAWGYYPTNHPDTSDHTVDLEWGFPASLLNHPRYQDHTTISDFNQFYFEGSLLHELGHARYLVDVYAFAVHEATVQITEDGVPVAGTDLMPLVWGDDVYHTDVEGLMTAQYTYVDWYSARALNRIAGHRALNGNCNAPYNIGEFLNDLPAENVLTVTDGSGTPLPGADVQVYMAEGVPGVYWGKLYADAPDLELTTDALGQCLLGRCPFSPDGDVQHTYGISNVIAIVRIEWQEQVWYRFLDVMFFNEAYWAGETDVAEHTITVDVSSGAEDAPAALVLLGNAPNPFNPATQIRFETGREMRVRVGVYDLAGRLVAVVRDEVLPAGPHAAVWDGRDGGGREQPSGSYLYRIEGDGTRKVGMMALLR